MFFFSIFGLCYSSIIFSFSFFCFQFLCLTRKTCYTFSGKFGAFFASIPLPIFAAIYCVLYGLVGEVLTFLTFLPFTVSVFLNLSFLTAAVGVTFIQFTNNNSMRNIYIMGLSLFLGISIPQYFVANTNGNTGHGPVHSGGGWVWIMTTTVIFNRILNFFFYYCLSNLKWMYGQFDDALNTIFASAPMVALIVGMILDNTLDPHHARDERGVPWWGPFQHKKGDSRNEEFYSFPLRINEYVPTRFL